MLPAVYVLSLNPAVAVSLPVLEQLKRISGIMHSAVDVETVQCRRYVSSSLAYSSEHCHRGHRIPENLDK